MRTDIVIDETTYGAFAGNMRAEVSHAIRNPVTGILGMLFILGETRLTKQQQDCLEMIKQSANRILALEPKLCAVLSH